MNAFVPEPFWYIHVGLNREGTTTSFSWRRGRLYDQPVAEAVFTMVEMDPEATVTKWETKPTQKWSASCLRSGCGVGSELNALHHCLQEAAAFDDGRAAEVRLTPVAYVPQACARGELASSTCRRKDPL